jgi:hypothetical protein
MHQSIWAAGTALVVLGLSTTVQAQSLAPNRALYVFEPSRLSQNGGSMPLEGRIAYELTGNDCTGYEVDSRVGNIYAGDTGQKRMDLQAATFEAGDGKSFEVRQTQFVNQVAGDEEHISVSRDAAGAGAGKIRGTKKVDFALKPEVLFPSAYEKKLIAAALKGEKRDISLVYDGSDSEKVFRAIAVLGPKQPAGTNATDKANPITAPLLGENSWQVSISYFPAADDKAEQPDYQTDLTMYENGIASTMLIDYGTYAMKGKLAKLEMLPAETCAASAPTDASKAGTPQ